MYTSRVTDDKRVALTVGTLHECLRPERYDHLSSEIILEYHQDDLYPANMNKCRRKRGVRKPLGSHYFAWP